MNKAVRSDDGTFTKTAITKESLYASGIPENAVPAKAFFVDDSISKEEAWSKKYINPQIRNYAPNMIQKRK